MTRARRDQRWREQAARLIDASQSIGLRRGTVDARNHRVARILRVDVDAMFDVAAVRAYSERLIAESDALDKQREVFADWTRAKGKGPENRDRGVFRSLPFDYPLHGKCTHLPGTTCDHCDPLPAYDAFLRGGWPGNLAREFVTEQRKRRRCSRPDCDGGVLVGEPPLTVRFQSVDGGPALCPECVRFNASKPSRAFVNGGNMRHAAQRLLDTLDGRCPWAPDADAQPSECQACGHVEIKGAEIELVEADGVTRSWTQDSKTYALKRGVTTGLDVFGSGCMATAQVQARGPSGSVIAITLQGQHVSHVLSENWTSFRVPIFDQGMTSASLRITVTRMPCHACNGTGHNLRGVLPPLPAETLRKLQSRPRAYAPADVGFTFGGRPIAPSPTVMEAVRREVERFISEAPRVMTPDTLHHIEHVVRTVLDRHGSPMMVRVEPDLTNPTNVSLTFTEQRP